MFSAQEILQQFKQPINKVAYEPGSDGIGGSLSRLSFAMEKR
jgi:predicted Rdx family selenoprotein